MKKLALALSVLAFSFTGAKAQVQFGLKGGMNLSTLTNSTGGSTLINFNAGILVKARLDQVLSLQPEAYYSGQGIKAPDGKLSVNYINVPLLLTYTLPTGLFFQTGPQLGILLSAKAVADSVGSQDLKEFFKSTDFNWAFGMGYLIPNVDFGFNLRYNLGISSVGKLGGTSKNSVFQIGIFYLFKGTYK